MRVNGDVADFLTGAAYAAMFNVDHECVDEQNMDDMDGCQVNADRHRCTQMATNRALDHHQCDLDMVNLV